MNRTTHAAPTSCTMSARSKRAAPTSLTRDENGSIWPSTALNTAGQQQLDELLKFAVNVGLLKSEHKHCDQKGSEILFHYVYDVLVERGRVQAAIVQEQVFWWCSRRSRSCMTAKYVLLTRVKDGLKAKKLDSTCGRRATNAANLGDLVRHYTGAMSIRCASPKVDTSGPCAFSVLLELEHGLDTA